MRLKMTGKKTYEEIQRGGKMAGKTKDGGEKESPIMKVATFIVDRRNLFFLLFGIAIIFSVVSMNWVSVENAMSAYLPDTTETSQGLERMEEQFVTYGTAQVMVTNIPYSEAEKIAERLEGLDTVIMLTLTTQRSITTISLRSMTLPSDMKRQTSGRWKPSIR